MKERLEFLCNTGGALAGLKLSLRDQENSIPWCLTRILRKKLLKTFRDFKIHPSGMLKGVFHTEEVIFFMDLQELGRHLLLKLLLVQ